MLVVSASLSVLSTIGSQMGKRGPAPKPTNLRVLHGEEERRINRHEPQPPTHETVPPAWLSPAAVEVWQRLAPTLHDRGLLTAWDVDTFAILCDAVAQYQAASALVARSGLLVKGQRGTEVRKNPAMQVVRDTAQTVRAFAQEFGLTPSARTQLAVQEMERGSEAALVFGRSSAR